MVQVAARLATRTEWLGGTGGGVYSKSSRGVAWDRNCREGCRSGRGQESVVGDPRVGGSTPPVATT